MLGYYDPDSFAMEGETRGVITFIDMTDADNRRKVTLDTPERARRVAASLRGQARSRVGISALEGEAAICSGTLTMTEGRPDEGVLVRRTETPPIVPVRLAIVDLPEMPGHSRAVLMGRMEDGAMIAEIAAIEPVGPMPDRVTRPDSGS